MSPRTDLELVSAFQSGDEGAFNELVLRHQEKLYWLARRFVTDHAEADDVLQDALVKAYQGLKTFRGESNVFTWFYRITVNTSINSLRRKRVRDFLRLDDVLIESAGDDLQPDEVLEQDEHRRLLDEAIQQLPEKQKAVFILRYHDELPYEEISQILQTSVGGLKANYFHAVKKVTESIRRAHDPR
jgi:RNA polymerase sigma-70 factor (ECF subfamily)